MPKKLALKLGIQNHQILTNDDEVCIPSLSSLSCMQIFYYKSKEDPSKMCQVVNNGQNLVNVVCQQPSKTMVIRINDCKQGWF